MAIQLNTCKGNATFTNLDDAAAWLVTHQPAFADVNGVALDGNVRGRCDRDGWTERGARAAIRQAVQEAR